MHLFSQAENFILSQQFLNAWNDAVTRSIESKVSQNFGALSDEKKEQLLGQPIETLFDAQFPKSYIGRVRNVLASLQIKTIRDLVRLTPKRLLTSYQSCGV